MAYNGWRVVDGGWVPTTATLVVESYPSLRRNHKKGRKIHKSRSEAKSAKIRAFNAETKAAVKLERRLTAKIIDKSRKTKRRLKNMESGIRTPMEENDASNEADYVLCVIGEEEQKHKEDEKEKQKQEGQKEWAKRRKERERWVELAKEYGFKLAHQMLEDEMLVGLWQADGDVFYNSDGESVLFDDMEPVQ